MPFLLWRGTCVVGRPAGVPAVVAKKVAGSENFVQSSGPASQCACLGKVSQEGFGCFQCILLANVEEFQFFRQYTFYAYLVAMPEIEVHDGEFAGVCLEYWREGVRPHGVYAGEGVHLAVFGVEIFVWTPDFAGGSVRPPYELHLLVEKQVALCFTSADEQRRVVCGVFLVELPQVCIAQDVNVVEEYGGAGLEQWQCFLQAAAGIEQFLAFVADFYLDSPVVLRQVVDDLL